MSEAEAGGSRAAALLDRQAEVLAAAWGMRFVREATDGTLLADDFARYLLVEEAFVLTAARVLGRIVWESPTWEDVVPHAQSLTNLVGEQRAYFAALRGRWPVPHGTDHGAMRQAAVLSDVVLAQTGKHGRPAALVGMFAAETLYARWCTAAAAHPAPRDRDLQAWIDLHVSPAFLAQVEALRADVDALDPDVVPDADLDDWFGSTLRAEIVFHDAVHVL